MEALETYTSTLAVLSAALLLVAAGLAKKQLVWKRAKPAPARRRRRRSSKVMSLLPFERNRDNGRSQ
jgi:hypothetical protein